MNQNMVFAPNLPVKMGKDKVAWIVELSTFTHFRE